MTSRIPPRPVERPTRPVLGKTPPPTNRIPRTKGPLEPDRRWTFSFRFFKQERYFAFEGLKVSWFASLFERLQSMCGLAIERVLKDPTMQSDLRIHTVKWGSEASHFPRSHFDWIAQEYLDAEEEYPLMQFQVSTGLGRVVGFFDETHTFQVVALDPKHNLQISSGRESRKDCQVIRSDLHDTKVRMDRALKALDSQAGAVEKARDILSYAVTLGNPAFDKHWIVLELAEKDATALHKHLCKTSGSSVGDVLERVLFQLEEEATSAPTS